MESTDQNEIKELHFPQTPLNFDTCKACFCPMVKEDKKEICLWCEIHGNEIPKNAKTSYETIY